MSLRDTISIQLAAIDLGQASCFDANLFAKEVINKVLDAAVEAAETRKRGQDLYSWEFDAAINEAITAINKLRSEK